ncbi:hypothetical protein GOP47_0021356 [Adiantum capillus-veneris]|uniref:Uncharacterized protein n=1 Tax=Adiantum capillus-veneris TaxID=13818 RepID=A0A9D4U769_ADICA|nr:hypothetical protein GOP47_0021356 [Adiantum capillus-veneris]
MADMEGNDVPPPRSYTRPEFVPKQPPRRRQRGALPRLDEQQHGLIAKHAPTLQVRVSTSTPTTPSQQECVPEDQRLLLPPHQPLAAPMHPTEETSMQSGLLPQPRGHKAKRQNTTRDFAQGAVNFSRSWHRGSTQEKPNQGGALMPADGHTYPQPRGAIQGQVPLTVPPLIQGVSNAPPLSARSARSLYPFLETKASFEGMWHQLEAAIQCREGMLMNMMAEMEKCVSRVKTAKVNAVKEKEEAEARKAAAMQNLEIINKETGTIKRVRESLEQISTDLSVQVAELNLLLQQAQERQRVLELLENLKEHYDASEIETRNHMDKSLQKCEAQLAMMEKELECSKKTSALLEKSALTKIGNLEEIETGCLLSKLHHRKTDVNLAPSKMKAVERPPGLNEREWFGQTVLTLPKLEPV